MKLRIAAILVFIVLIGGSYYIQREERRHSDHQFCLLTKENVEQGNARAERQKLLEEAIITNAYPGMGDTSQRISQLEKIPPVKVLSILKCI